MPLSLEMEDLSDMTLCVEISAFHFVFMCETLMLFFRIMLNLRSTIFNQVQVDSLDIIQIRVNQLLRQIIIKACDLFVH